jgi:hypothetical protein
MSNDAMNWARKCSIKRSSDKFLLVMLAATADGNNICSLSQAALVEDTALDPKTVRAGIVRLKEAGYIVDTKERKGHGHQTIVWQLALPKTVGPDPPKTVGHALPKTVGQKPSPTKNGTLPFFPDEMAETRVIPKTALPKTVGLQGVLTTKERKKERLSPPSNAAIDADPDFIRFWSGYPKKKQKGDARKAWVAALKKTTADVILQALEKHEFNPDQQYRPYPASWLNGECWLDEPSKVTPVSQKQADDERWGRF